MKHNQTIASSSESKTNESDTNPSSNWEHRFRFAYFPQRHFYGTHVLSIFAVRTIQ